MLFSSATEAPVLQSEGWARKIRGMTCMPVSDSLSLSQSVGNSEQEDAGSKRNELSSPGMVEL